MQETQEPTITHFEQSKGSHYEYQMDHPAFGQVVLTRPQGGQVSLYGSDFKHNSTICMTFYESSLSRGGSHDWPHQGKIVLQLEMSEAQWAHFVSSFSDGTGTQCTFKYRNGISVPSITHRDEIHEFKHDLKSTQQDALKALDELSNFTNTLKLSNASIVSLKRKIALVRQNIYDNSKYVVECFDKHMEKRVQAAKTEVHAYMQNAIHSVGLEAIQSQAPLMLENQEDNK